MERTARIGQKTRRGALGQLAALSAAGAGAALAACGQQASTPPTTQTARPATVEWRHSGGNEAVVARWTDYSTDVKAALAPKNITVNLNFESSQMWEKLQAEFAGGSGPDVVYNQVNWYILGGVRGVFKQLDDRLQRDKVRADAYNKGAMDSWVWKGKRYAMPYSGFGETVFLYKKRFEEASLPLPSLSWTWEDMLSIAKKLTKGEGTTKQFGLVVFHGSEMGITPTSWMYNNGGKVLNDTRDKAMFAADAKSLQAYEWLADLRTRHGVEPKTEERTVSPHNPNTRLQPMNEGRAAMEMARFSRYGEFIGQLGQGTVEVYPLPSGPANRRSHAVGTNGWSIGRNTKVKDAAWELVKHLTGPGQLGKGTRTIPVPALTAAATSKEFIDQYAGTKIKETFDAWAKDSHDYMVNPDQAEVGPAFTKHASAAWAGEKTTRQALRDAADEIDIIFARRPTELR